MLANSCINFHSGSYTMVFYSAESLPTPNLIPIQGVPPCSKTSMIQQDDNYFLMLVKLATSLVTNNILVMVTLSFSMTTFS